MSEQLSIYKKGETTPLATGDPKTGVQITGLAAGTVVPTGDYQAVKHDSTGNKTDSNKVDVPGFTVLGGKETDPTNVKSVATKDGATVTSE